MKYHQRHHLAGPVLLARAGAAVADGHRPQVDAVEQQLLRIDQVVADGIDVKAAAAQVLVAGVAQVGADAQLARVVERVEREGVVGAAPELPLGLVGGADPFEQRFALRRARGRIDAGVGPGLRHHEGALPWQLLDAVGGAAAFQQRAHFLGGAAGDDAVVAAHARGRRMLRGDVQRGVGPVRASRQQK
ncbi:conserved hypothetical protein [Ricinus communis]|uniref:Uncharacterized protein n=1 Tax=Ricinus communis TaxID=3988 RepID=B9TC52_RICCO|nr:conserved hypothetical protein [Ricinus communis]